MRLLALVLAACAAAAPLRAGELRSGAAEAVSARPAVSIVGTLPSFSSPLGAVSSLPGARLEAGVALPAAVALPKAASLPAAAAQSAQAPGAVAAGKTAAAVRMAGNAEVHGAVDFSARAEASNLTEPLRAGEASPRDGFWAAEAISPAAQPEAKAPRFLGHARRIAKALGQAAAPQDLPLESTSEGGPAPLKRPTYQHAPGHVDDSQPPAPEPAPRRGGGYKRLFGPSLALSLMALPSLAHGNPFTPLAAGFHLTVSLPLALLAAVIALARLPVTSLLLKTNPHSLGEGDGGSDKLARLPLVLMPPVIFFFAACEELVFRGMVFGGGVMLLATHVHGAAAHPALLYAGAALASSVGFAYMHRYSEMWPRLIGGLVYCAAFAMTGSLLFPTLIHTFYNLTLLAQRKRELAREEGRR